MPVSSTIARSGLLATLTLMTACGGAKRGNEGVALLGGISPRTDLQAATGLAPGSVYTVARVAKGWRVVYRAVEGSAADVAARLCGLERRAPATIRDEAIASSDDLPGARKILITCRG